jgi:hypothetical protein
MSSNRKPAFKWIGIDGVYRALEEIKKVLRNKTAVKSLKRPIS